MNENVFTRDVIMDNIKVNEHIYNTKNPIFYFCFKHAHYHKSHPTIKCIIQEFQCCDEATSVEDFTECFTITTLSSPTASSSSTKTNRNDIKKATEWIIYDPSIWRDQSYNHFMSFIRAIIVSPADMAERYKRFESSNFTISSIRRHISGKESKIRTAVTGFETYGAYQTSTISCIIPYFVVVLPAKLYDELNSEGFDLDLVLVKRDPSILQTCMYVCAVRRHDDPRCLVTTISDQQSKGMNQDQDGDRNAQYLLRKRYNGYDCTKSFDYKVAKMEMANAFCEKKTLIGTHRYHLSETRILKIKRHPEDFRSSVLFEKCQQIGGDVKSINEAGAGYLADEHDYFQELLRQHTENETPSYIKVSDILLETERLPSIVTSGAKGNINLIEMLLDNISSVNGKTLTDKTKDMIDLCNKYITSSQDLSRNGRKQFAALYSAHDLVSFNGNIYINKLCYANYEDFASAGTFLFNNTSLKLFVLDLKAL